MQLEIGGPTQTQIAYHEFARDRLDRVSGMHETRIVIEQPTDRINVSGQND